MVGNTRPKRKAATKQQIIELSDSEDDYQIDSSKRRREDDSEFNVDFAAKKVTSNASLRKASSSLSKAKSKASSAKTPRWPTKILGEVPNDNTENFDVNREINENVAKQCAIGNPQRMRSTRASVGGACRRIWDLHELLAETEDITPRAARNIVELFNQENTIPFICRYRRDLIDHITPDRLRDIRNTFTEIVDLRKKAENIVTQLEKAQVVDNEIRNQIMCAKSAEELEFLYAPYKPANKGSLAERAKALGLEVYADRLLYGEAPSVVLESIVRFNNENLNTPEKVLEGICHIIQHNMSKHTGILEEIRSLQKVNHLMLQSKKSTSCEKAEKTATASTSGHHKGNNNVASKYEIYFNFEADVQFIKPHQILAINRGEKSKFLTVKVIVPDRLKFGLKNYANAIYMSEGLRYPLRTQVFEKCFEECYKKKLQPLITRQVRAFLNEYAHKASVEVFANNLKQLLLMSPLKGECILGIDPGFTNGCKMAVISEAAAVLETGVMYLHTRNADPEECGERLAKILARHNCKLIALGNGTACRETEFWLSKMIREGIIDARYCIVSEQGASIYSCSDIAKKEFPKMDTNEISAVSIARRLNDPLSEYVKIQPRHIGVGMYQHDLNEKVLDESLNDVVSECVSYVGVDINTASLSILKHVAGLTEKKADKILEHRDKSGLFSTRKDLLKVKSIGEKTFVQFAGFIRIEPRSLGKPLENPLDCTWVHPEAYTTAKKIITKCKLSIKDIGQPDFIAKIKSYMSSSNIEELAKEYNLPKERLNIVLIALQREPLKDYRADFGKRPLFKQGLTRLSDLSEGDVVTGAITNITHFGAFVDIGVECEGLIHVSKMGGTKVNVGDSVTTSVVSVDVSRRRIGLRLETKLVETDTSLTFE